MNFAEKYIAKNKTTNFFKNNEEEAEAEIIVVIPSFNETEINETINSLFQNTPLATNVLILVVINDFENCSDTIKQQNKKTIEQLKQLKNNQTQTIQLRWIYAANLPVKHAGAGWARKIGMDWAITHFNKFNRINGIIVSLDADSFVQPNYLNTIHSYFKGNIETVAATIYFEHPIENTQTGNAIVLYELYMRYYKNAIKYIGFPNSIYTLGSCFAVRAKAYVDQGGMNRRKAGEDFYFLHKLMPLGHIGEINNTTVFPSSRISDRVPFGTGPVLKKYLDGNRELEKTYPLEAFLILKPFFKNIENYYHNSIPIEQQLFLENRIFYDFCIENNLIHEIIELANNCSSLSIFKKRFFHLFNAFRILKWLNYAQQNGFEKTDLQNEAQKLLGKMSIKSDLRPDDPKLMLKLFRELDKAQRFA